MNVHLNVIFVIKLSIQNRNKKTTSLFILMKRKYFVKYVIRHINRNDTYEHINLWCIPIMRKTRINAVFVTLGSQNKLCWITILNSCILTQTIIISNVLNVGRCLQVMIKWSSIREKFMKWCKKMNRKFILVTYAKGTDINHFLILLIIFTFMLSTFCLEIISRLNDNITIFP